MAVPPTDWQARAKELDARGLLITVDGEKEPWGFLAGSDAPVAIDMSGQLAVGEPLTNPVLTLWKMYAVGEAADVNVSATSIPDAPVITGNQIQQRVKALDPGRVYLLKIHHGAAANRRGPAMMIQCLGEVP